jgi:molybdate transport system ATP-binding protein
MNPDYELRLRVRLRLDRFDLDVDHRTSRRATGIFGPSGAGKTNLLKIIAGLETRAHGLVRLGDRVWLDSEDAVYLPPEARDIGYVPQDGLLFPHMNVRQNLLAGAARAGGNGRSPTETLDRVCELLELGQLLERRVAALSGGERQRVSLGRALCSGPRLLLLDEPLASLDIPLRRRVLPFLHRVRQELEVPMVLVSHDPTEVQALCDELLVLEGGRVVTRGPTREVLTDPRVFELGGDEPFENLLPCRVGASEGAVTEVWLGRDADGARLLTPRSEIDPGSELLVAIPADEIIIALGRPEGISALNVLPARVSSVQAIGHNRLVAAEISPQAPPVTAKITERACDQLALTPGRPIYLIIKTVACRLLGAEAD